jgi:hypothetical protein
MTIAWVCIELRLLVPNVISDSCVLAQFNAVGFVLYILSYYYLYFLCPCCGVRYNFRKRLFCWSLSLLFVVQFMSYCDVCLRILVSNIMPYRLLVSNIMPYRILVSNIMPYRILVSNIMPYHVFVSVLWYPLRFQHKTIFGSFLPFVLCRRTHILCMLFVFICE